MIILSNTCTGSFIYKIKHWPLNTPTCWAMVDYLSLRNLCESISFKQELPTFEYTLKKSKVNGNTYVMGSAPGINIHYVHYLYSNSTISGSEHKPQRVDIVGKDILEYTQLHITERLNRMLYTDNIVCILDAIYCKTEVPELTSYDLDDFYTWSFPNTRRILVTANQNRYNRYKQKDNFIPILGLNRKPRSNASQLLHMGVI